MQEEQYYTGSDLKFKIDLTASGFDQASDEYKIEVSCGSKTVTFTDKDVKKIGNDYYLLINTDLLRAGPMKFKVTAYVPDNAFDSGVRREVDVKKVGTLKNPV